MDSKNDKKPIVGRGGGGPSGPREEEGTLEEGTSLMDGNENERNVDQGLDCYLVTESVVLSVDSKPRLVFSIHGGKEFRAWAEFCQALDRKRAVRHQLQIITRYKQRLVFYRKCERKERRKKRPGIA